MKKTDTKQKILNKAKELFAIHGYEGVSMRSVAKELNIAPSVIYHHFESKDNLLQEAFEMTRKELGRKRAKKLSGNLQAIIRNRVNYQLDNALDVTYILKYYLHYRDQFEKNEQGYVPKTAYKHIYEILEEAKNKGDIPENMDIDAESKVITHAINGFVLEYYPNIPKKEEKDEIVDSLTNFIFRSLTNNQISERKISNDLVTNSSNNKGGEQINELRK